MLVLSLVTYSRIKSGEYNIKDINNNKVKLIAYIKNHYTLYNL